VSGVAVLSESARPPDKCVQRRSVSGGAGTAGATAGRTPTQNALVEQVGPTQFTPPHQTRQDCCACLSIAAARPPTRSDAERQAKCKHAVNCCI